MIINTSQEQIVINPDSSGYPKNNIGIKLSGGADSSILCYMLYKYAVEHGKKLVPMTVVHGLKPTNKYPKVYYEPEKDKGVKDLLSSISSSSVPDNIWMPTLPFQFSATGNFIPKSNIYALKSLSPASLPDCPYTDPVKATLPER